MRNAPFGNCPQQTRAVVGEQRATGRRKITKKVTNFREIKGSFFSSTLSTKLTSFNVSWSLLCYFLPRQTKLGKETPFNYHVSPWLNSSPFEKAHQHMVTYTHMLQTPWLQLDLNTWVKLRTHSWMEALVLAADTCLPEVGKSLTPNMLALKIMPWTSQWLTNSKFKHFYFLASQ